MDAALIGSVLGLLGAAIASLTAFAIKLYSIQEHQQANSEANERRCSARLNIHRRRQWAYESVLAKVQREHGVTFDRTELTALDEQEQLILIGDPRAIAAAEAGP